MACAHWISVGVLTFGRCNSEAAKSAVMGKGKPEAFMPSAGTCRGCPFNTAAPAWPIILPHPETHPVDPDFVPSPDAVDSAPCSGCGGEGGANTVRQARTPAELERAILEA